jgi:hypothetical protein
MVWAVLLLLVSIFFLAKGADLLVDGASHRAYARGVTPLKSAGGEANRP